MSGILVLWLALQGAGAHPRALAGPFDGLPCTVEGASITQLSGPFYGPTPGDPRTPRPTTTPARWVFARCQGGQYVQAHPFGPGDLPPREDLGMLWPQTFTATRTPTNTRTPTKTPTP